TPVLRERRAADPQRRCRISVSSVFSHRRGGSGVWPRLRAKHARTSAPWTVRSGRAERPRVPRERVARPVELRDAAVRVSDDLEELAALAAAHRAEPVLAGRLEDRRLAPVGRLRGPRLEPSLAPREDELRPLRPPAAE